jgi:hypothetical protein
MQHPLSSSIWWRRGVFRHGLRLVQKGLFAVAVCEFGYTEEANFRRRVFASLLAWGLPLIIRRCYVRSKCDFKLSARTEWETDGWGGHMRRAVSSSSAHADWEREICRAFPRNDSICFYWIRLSVANCVNTAGALLWRGVGAAWRCVYNAQRQTAICALLPV